MRNNLNSSLEFYIANNYVKNIYNISKNIFAYIEKKTGKNQLDYFYHYNVYIYIYIYMCKFHLEIVSWTCTVSTMIFIIFYISAVFS